MKSIKMETVMSFPILGILSYQRQSSGVKDTGELAYDRLNGTRKIGPSYAKSVVYI